MTLTVLRTPPKQIAAGDSIEFLAPIPSDLSGYTGSARLVCQSSTAGAVAMDASSVTVEGDCYRVKFEGQSAGGTKALTPGQYTLTVWATSANDRYTVGSWPISVTPNLATGSPALAHAQKMLVAIENAIYARVNGGEIEEYTIDGTSIRKADLEVLERLRSKYSAEVSRLQNGDAIGTVKMQFSPAGNPTDLRRRYS